MAELQRNFLQGIMNKDLDPHFLPDGQYRDALNIIVGDSDGQFVSTEGSNNGAAQNYLGNTLMNSALGLNNARCIGSLAYDASNLIYWLVAADNADAIYEYNEALDLTTIVLKATKSTPTTPSLLNFNKTFYVTGINYINGLLFWTDNYNPPRRINVERAKNYGVDGFAEDDISVIVAPPLSAPSISLSNSGDSNNLEDKFLYFSYRYKYIDNEYSALSPFSPVAFLPKQYEYDYGVSENISMTNFFNTVTLTYNRGGDNVTEVQLIYRDTRSVNAYIIDNIQTSTLSSSANQTYQFKNNKVYTILDANQVNRLFDNVPLKAKSQELIGSRLIYGNYTQFFNLVDCLGEPIAPVFSLSLTTQTITGNNPKPTFKSNRDYEVGIVYLDDYGRSTTVIVPKGNNTINSNTIFVPPQNANKANNIRVTIDKNFEPPCFATYYRFVLKQNRQNYYNVFPLTYFTEGQFKWFLINQADLDKISVGSYLYLKNSTNPSLDTQFKVLDIESKNANFLNNSNSQPAGVYFKIKIPSSILPSVFTYNGNSTRTSVSPVLTNVFSVAENPIFYGTGINNMITSNSNIYSVTTSNTGSPSVDIRFYVEIDSVGTVDTFQIYAMVDGKGKIKISTSSIPITANVNQTLTYSGTITSSTFASYDATLSCNIRFSSANGHTIGDYWVVNCRASTQPNSLGIIVNIFGGEFGFTSGGVSYVTLRGWNVNSSNNSDRPIYPGAILKFTAKYSATGTEISKQFISSGTYVNIEEWFIEDGAWTSADFVGEGTKYVTFRRVTAFPTDTLNPSASQGNSISNATLIEPVAMIVGRKYVDASSTYMYASLNVAQQDTTTLFETVPIETSQDIYYELTGTYQIINGNHQGNVTDQIIGLSPAVVDLNTYGSNSNFNAFAWGNNVESYRIRDDFNSATMEFSPRANSTIEGYEQQVLVQALTYSGVYQQTTAINRLNEFNLSLGNFKYLDLFFGSIEKLYSRDTDLVVLQENKVSKVLYGKNLLSDSVGGGTIASIPEVLGTQIAYVGEYGISNNPESFAIWGNNLFFTDVRRGAVLMLSESGISEISSQGMKNWFKTNLTVNNQDYSYNTQKIGIFDPYFEHYVLSSNDNRVDYCLFDVNEDAVTVPFGGYASFEYAFTITSNSEWYIVPQTNNWLTLNTLYGNGNTLIYYKATANTGAQRSVNVNVLGCDADFDIVFTQQAVPIPTTTTTSTTTTTTAGPTTTTSTTSTTTIPITYEYYLASQFLCGDCVTPVATDVLVKFVTGTLVIPSRFYREQTYSNYAYEITDTGQAPGVAYILTTPAYNTCEAACASVSTTTTTSTTTIQTVWYELTNCTTQQITYSIGYLVGQFALNDRVTIGLGTPFIISDVLTSDPGGSTFAITATGFTGCPSATTTTTSTTTIEPFDYYLANEYICGTCDIVETGVLVKVTPGTLILLNRFYQPYDTSNYVYEITDTDQPVGVAIRIKTPAYNTCALVPCPSTTSTTSTTTIQTVWYELERCSNGAIAYSIGYLAGSFSINERVLLGGITYVIVNVLTSDPGGSTFPITSTGFTGCPTVTTTTTSTTTTAAPYDYYLATQYVCGDCGTPIATDLLVKFAAGTTVIPSRFYKELSPNNYTYEITDTGQAPGSAYELTTPSYLSCAASCPATTTSTSTTTAGPTTTSTTTIQYIWYELTNCNNSNISYSISYPAGTFAINDRVIIGISTTVKITDVLTTDPGGSQSSITSTGLTGCPGDPTTTTSTTTAAPTTTTTSTTTAAPTTTTTSTTTAAPTTTSTTTAAPTTTSTTTVAPTTTTTSTTTAAPTTTTTSTTTIQTVWYEVTRCSNGSIVYSIAYTAGTFGINDRVTIAGVNYVITNVLTFDPGTSLQTLTYTGLTGCPTVTTTTTSTTTAAPTTTTTSTTTAAPTTTTTSTTTAAPTTTTTSTTTAAPTTTTTSTTTAAPTTTSTTTSTTTAAPIQCFTYNWVCDNGFGAPCELSWTNCDGSPGSDFVSDGAGGSVCAQVDTFGIGNGSWTQGGGC